MNNREILLNGVEVQIVFIFCSTNLFTRSVRMNISKINLFQVPFCAKLSHDPSLNCSFVHAQYMF